MKPLIALIILLVMAAAFVGCGGGAGGAKTSPAPATVNVSVSDPTTCSVGASGPYLHIFVTITDVQINASATASDNDTSWVDLTPNLKSAPQQVDLLGLANSQCFLASLGSTTALQPGSYQQIRVILADNSVKPANDACKGVAANCVVLGTDPFSPKPLLLSSESKTGIKIPSGQIAGGQFTIAAGETKDLNLDFDSCASIVVQGNGQFRLKPVLHAGEVSLTSASINGKLVDQATGQPISGGKAIVALEQKDTNGIDRVVMQTTPASDGTWNFCPVPAGTYDVVAVAVSGSNVAYAATITTGVTPGAAVGTVKMFATQGASTAPATLQGDVTTANTSAAGTGADIALSALQQVTINTTSLTFTIPVGAQSAVVAVTTEKPSTCASGTCPTFSATYTMTVPPLNPTTGAFAASGTNYTAGSGAASYLVEAQAFVPGSGGTGDCNPSKLTSSPLTAAAGQTSTVPTLAFTGCQ
jgi:hypothetical protein